MSINATLLGQMITFGLFVWFTMKFVWPLLEDMLKQRSQKIAEGLQAAEHGHKELELAKKLAVKEIREARAKIVVMLDKAHKQSTLILEEARSLATQERDQIIALGHTEIVQQRRLAEEILRTEAVNHAILVAEKLLGRAVNDGDQRKLLDQFAVLGE